MPAHDWTRVIPGVFHDFHSRWISAIRDYLNAGRLPADYYALSGQMVDGHRPDVITLQAPSPHNVDSQFSESGESLALLDAPPKVSYVDECEPNPYVDNAHYVTIRHASGDELFAIIEIVSSGNKKTKLELDRFLDKIESAIQSGTHVLLIDLSPPDRWDPNGIHAALWRRRSDTFHAVTEDRPLGLSSYCANDSPRAYFEPIALGTQLPDMPIFLTPNRYVNVALESTYLESWERFPKRWKTVLESPED